MPEVGPLPAAPVRVSSISIAPDDHACGPVGGLAELREAVATLYLTTGLISLDGRHTVPNQEAANVQIDTLCHRSPTAVRLRSMENPLPVRPMPLHRPAISGGNDGTMSTAE